MVDLVEKKILELIENEDKKNPLTDSEIAKIVNSTREYVTQFRIEKNIPNSRQRKEQILLEDIKKILIENGDISDRQLYKKLIDIGYEISRFTVSQIRSQIKEEIQNKKEEEYIAENVAKNVVRDNQNENSKKENSIKKANENLKSNNENPLRKIIGCNGSLKNQIIQAEAAVLYPPHGLHTLLLGPSGVGKSYFAEVMYKYAINTQNFKEDAPFITFNCADYADNPQLLLAQLFGYVKGAFTGANEEKSGLVEKADGGILFLDEVHRLPKEGQEMLFYLLDKGRYRKLGETNNDREVKVMIIAATTEDPKSSLLLTFRRRIPMIIELPSINSRPINERYVLIKNFFAQEASRVGKQIIVKNDVVKFLLSYDCPGNIGQLRSDIQVLCAKSFLNSLSNNDEYMVIEIASLQEQIKTGIYSKNNWDISVENILNGDLIVNPHSDININIMNDRYILPDEIYKDIEERYHKLEEQGISKDEINKIVWSKVELDLNKFAKDIESNLLFPKEELKNIIDEKILNVADKITNIAKKYKENIKENFYYCIAIHLNSIYERLNQGKLIKNPHLDIIKDMYEEDYRIANILAAEISKDLNINLPEDEIGFIAMYLKTFSSVAKKVNRVAVIVLTHGHVACGMVDVANKLLGVNFAVGIEMSLDESPSVALKKTIEVVKNIDEGKGCLLLVDMGSFTSFGDIITKETGIPTRVISRVDTVMVLEAVRRAIISDSNLDEIAEVLEKDVVYKNKIRSNVNKVSKAIITVCITGEGTAETIKKYIEEMMTNENCDFKIIPLAMMSKEDFDTEIQRIKENYNVVAIVGTINPEIENIPFISVQEIIRGSGKNLLKKLVKEKGKNPLYEIFNEEYILVKDYANEKGEVIDELSNLLYEKGNVDEKFLMSVYKREIMKGTVLSNGVAIPHGSPDNVIKSSIAVLKLNNPIEWDNDFYVNIIIMLALKESDKEIVIKLNEILSNQEIVSKLKNANTVKEIKDIILEE